MRGFCSQVVSLSTAYFFHTEPNLKSGKANMYKFGSQRSSYIHFESSWSKAYFFCLKYFIQVFTLQRILDLFQERFAFCFKYLTKRFHELLLLTFICIKKNCLNTKSLNLLYSSLIFPNIMFCASVWGFSHKTLFALNIWQKGSTNYCF